jgi:hypothetical protein
MAKGFQPRRPAKDAFTGEQMQWIDTWERFFDVKNGLRVADDGEFPHTITIRGAKRLEPGQVAGWPWLLSHFERVNASLRKSREPLVEFDAFPRTQSDCERVAAWRRPNPIG